MMTLFYLLHENGIVCQANSIELAKALKTPLLQTPLFYLSGMVFLLHADQCISQEYGSVVGRADTYYVRYYASLTNQTQFDLYPLLRDEYNPFVFGDGPLLFTERMNNFIYQM